MSHGIHGAHGHRHTHHAHGIFAGGAHSSAIERNAKLIESTLNLAQKAIDLATKFVDQMSKPMDSQGPSRTGGCFPSQPPNPCDAVREVNALKVGSNGQITTPGGYQIGQLGQFEW